ncbi:MAG: DUF3570 domain-containing protein [Gammaproteobacteria bacterium]|nr:DUF3570 domain-containing protein [Gammaproteobacteria bacterium]
MRRRRLSQLTGRNADAHLLVPDYRRHNRAPERRSPLRALTLAAMALPGLMAQPVCAEEGDSAGFQFGHYQEGERDLAGADSMFDPIEVDSFHTGVNFTPGDRLKGTVKFTEDAWSGATPVATAPLSAHGNRVTTTHVMTGASIEGLHNHDEEAEEETPAETDGVTGASPYLYSTLKLDGQYRPLLTDVEGAVIGGVDTELVHTMSSASREVRKQVDLGLSREFNESALNVGGGISHERDFESMYGSLGGRWDFNRKLTTLEAGLSYTASTTEALLDHDVVPHVYEPYMYIYERRGDDIYNRTQSTSRMELGEFAPTLTGDRTDWAMNLGATRILNKKAYLEANLGYTRSSGYLSNPYKAVEAIFIDPLLQEGQAGGNTSADYVYDAQIVALLEQRPDLRNQGTLNLRYVQHIAATDAALHLNYRYFQDDWGIRAHTLQTEWVQPVGDSWTLSPRLRYYSQSAADFYTPYLTTQQGLFTYVTDPTLGPIYINTGSPTDGIKYYEDQSGTVTPPIDPNPGSRNFGQPVVSLNGLAVINQQTGQPVNDQTLVDALTQETVPFDRKKLPEHYSSDSRLAGYGTLSAGITLVKRLAKGIRLELGYEYIEHAGSLKLGGGGEDDYIDYDASLFNAAVTIDLDSANLFDGAMEDHSGHAGHMHHDMHEHHAGGAPAGVMFDHMLAGSGDLMVGYRYMFSRQGGDILGGSNTGGVSDFNIINRACAGKPCYVRPTEMSMHMHMLDIMYAPTDWLNLMLMPQFVEMDMSMRLLDESPRTGGMDAIGMAITHSSHAHTSAGFGDTEMHALFRLFRGRSSGMHLGLGLSAPTGDVSVGMRNMMHVDMGLMDYGMQLGSGTWDFKPSLTYTGARAPLSWGVQLNGTMRLEDRNASGYALGDVLQATAWGSYDLGDVWSTSLRGIYTLQGEIEGAYNDTHIRIGPVDYPHNYGGTFIDLGLGLSASIRSGTFAGNRLSLEWLLPVQNDFNGHQLDREGTLVFNWGIHI